MARVPAPRACSEDIDAPEALSQGRVLSVSSQGPGGDDGDMLNDQAAICDLARDRDRAPWGQGDPGAICHVMR